MVLQEKRVLIVEDDEGSASLLAEIAGRAGFIPAIAVNGRDALEQFLKNPFALVVTDISMPEMDGGALIDSLTGGEYEPVVIVVTGHAEPSMIIDIMRRGVFDYLVKPVDVNDFSMKLARGYEISRLRRVQRSVERERTARVEKELDWYKWSERLANRESSIVDKSLFHSLHTSFNQGAGFGALLTLLSMIASNAKEENGRYLLDAQMMNLINDNVAVAANILKTFADIDWMLSHDLALESVAYDRLYDLVTETTHSMSREASVREQGMLLSERKPGLVHRSVKIDAGYLQKALAEILMNACKFSERAYPIYVLVEAVDANMLVSVVSRPFADEQGRLGIPLGYENIVFEPFYRMTKAVFEGYTSLDYGLGLSVVDKIMVKHGGKASISNILDYSDLTQEPITKVLASLVLPLQ